MASVNYCFHRKPLSAGPIPIFGNGPGLAQKPAHATQTKGLNLRLAVLSDIHDRSQNLAHILARLDPATIDALICCGDLGAPSIIHQLALFGAPLHICLGNCDQTQAASLLRMGHLRHAGICQGSGSRNLRPAGQAAFVHYPETAKELALSGLYKAVFYGHTHRARVEHLELTDGQRVLLANPGDIQGRYDEPRALLWDSESDALHWVYA